MLSMATKAATMDELLLQNVPSTGTLYPPSAPTAELAMDEQFSKIRIWAIRTFWNSHTYECVESSMIGGSK